MKLPKPYERNKRFAIFWMLLMIDNLMDECTKKDDYFVQPTFQGASHCTNKKRNCWHIGAQMNDIE